METLEMSRVGRLLQTQVSGLDIKGGDEGLDEISIWGDLTEFLLKQVKVKAQRKRGLSSW